MISSHIMYFKVNNKLFFHYLVELLYTVGHLPKISLIGIHFNIPSLSECSQYPIYPESAFSHDVEYECLLQ